MLCEIILQRIRRSQEFPLGFHVSLIGFHQFQELIILQSLVWILVKQSPNVILTDWIGKLVVLLSPDFRVLVEYGWVSFALVNSYETVIKTTNIDDTSCQAQTAEGIADCMCLVRTLGRGSEDHSLCAASAARQNLPTRILSTNR